MLAGLPEYSSTERFDQVLTLAPLLPAIRAARTVQGCAASVRSVGSQLQRRRAVDSEAECAARPRGAPSLARGGGVAPGPAPLPAFESANKILAPRRPGPKAARFCAMSRPSAPGLCADAWPRIIVAIGALRELPRGARYYTTYKSGVTPADRHFVVERRQPFIGRTLRQPSTVFVSRPRGRQAQQA